VSVFVMVAVVLAAAILLITVGWCLVRANRLDRLHVRTDAARAALVASLERRAVVSRALAVDRADQPLRDVSAAAERAPARDREARENDLSQRLAALDRSGLSIELATELDDAEQRVMLARRVYNDAVRDTLVLRSRQLVRWFRLAGTASAPAYFEIVDGVPDDDDRADDGPALVVPLVRRAGRVVLLDECGRTLLFEGFDRGRPQEPYWYTPGGGLEPGEDESRAATRELAEETGLLVPPERLVGPVWRSREVFSHGDDTVIADETFFLVTTDNNLVDASGITELERVGVLSHRWWSVDELRGTDAVVYPRRFADLLEPLLDGGWDGVTRSIS
jgi:8-oxo-dGTP pyrophosphatase MutT (NUDIX family)